MEAKVAFIKDAAITSLPVLLSFVFRVMERPERFYFIGSDLVYCMPDLPLGTEVS